MAQLLHRLGRFAYRRARLVIVAWVVILAGLLGGGIALGGQLQESFTIPGTESQEAIDQLAAVFPETAGASAKAVVQAPEGADVEDEPYAGAIEELADELRDVDGVANVLSPFDEYAGDQISADGRTAYVQVQFDGKGTDVTPEVIAAVQATAPVAEDAGLVVAYGGDVFQETTFGLTVTEVFGVVFAAVVLIVTFGSLLAAGMPLLTAIVGVGASFGVLSIAAAFTTVSSTAPMLAVMIGLAVGIDYALFIVSRHRNQLARGADPEESAAEAVATSGGAVVFAGLTVVIALLGLLVVGIPFLSVMGVGAAFAVAIAVLGAVTLLPAILGLAKGRLTPKPGSRAARRALADDDAPKKTMGRRWVDLVLKAPVVPLVLVVGVLGTAALPALDLDLNLPLSNGEAGSSPREAYDLIDEGFGPGYNGPLIITADITQSTDPIGDLASIRSDLEQVDGLVYVGQGLPNPAVDTAVFQVIPESAPNSTETKAIVEDLRELAPSLEDEYGIPLAVTGYTAVAIDISNRLDEAIVPFALIVVGLSVILLMMVFRSVFVPIKAAVGFLLSAFGAIGATVAAFQWGWFADVLHLEPGPILSFLPILLMAVLFGLAMDYEVFLVSGMREEFVHSRDPDRAVRHGFQHSARVVTAAALIMFFVFAAFVPEGAGPIKGIAFALAVGVAFDAFLVRMTLVPAAMALAGRGAWWLPRWLGRILPDVDIEGAGLRRHLEDARWAHSRDAALTLEGAEFGREDARFGPVDLELPGGTLVLGADAAERRILAATLAGRLPLVAGRAQVLGRPLPSDARAVLRRVAVAELSGSAGAGVTAGEVVAARLDAAAPVWRLAPAPAAIERMLGRARLAADDRAILPDAPLAALDPLSRAAVIAAAALAEEPGMLVVDAGDAAAPGIDRLASMLGIIAEDVPVVLLVPAGAAAADVVVPAPAEAHDAPLVLTGAASPAPAVAPVAPAEPAAANTGEEAR
ncbi:MMPL family transporter [Agromyces seonyuensis]|uniref:MMPL family transporter n=1 Tax=Agromyces seonyuensis TaxID=2662446 RepID=A0A6I4NV51_9MICO|nr:MMPL family transporter [Agromyces seonyuensis]MWB98258.1 MMPL family transporter [Agromyces seonyuensis]